MKKTLALALAALALASPALASGPNVPVEPYVAPPPVVTYNWTGGYAGFGVG